MTDAEFVSEVRRHLVAIMRAFILRYRLSWLDLLPPDAIERLRVARTATPVARREAFDAVTKQG